MRDINSFLYIDGGAFLFTNWEHLEIGSNIIYKTMAKFGLQMHIGENGKNSKSETMFFPSTDTMLRWMWGKKLLNEFGQCIDIEKHRW